MNIENEWAWLQNILNSEMSLLANEQSQVHEVFQPRIK